MGSLVCGSWAVHRCKGWLLLDIDRSIVVCQWLAPFSVSKVGLLPFEFLIGVSVVQEFAYFGVIICGVEDNCAPAFVCWQNGNVLISSKDALFLSGDVGGWSFCIGQNGRYLQSDLLCFCVRKFVISNGCFCGCDFFPSCQLVLYFSLYLYLHSGFQTSD